jgi:hypothetical protein
LRSETGAAEMMLIELVIHLFCVFHS